MKCREEGVICEMRGSRAEEGKEFYVECEEAEQSRGSRMHRRLYYVYYNVFLNFC